MPGETAHEYEVRESINHVVDASKEFLDTDARPVERDQHPKQHGCVRAWFVVAKNLPDSLRQGLFQEEKAYEAWIRLSSGAQRDDRKPDAHGMALKLMGVAGRKVLTSEENASTQDFVLIDNPTFFIRDAVEYARFSDVLLKASGRKPSSLFSTLGLVSRGPVRSLLTLFLLSLFSWRFPTFLRLIKFASKRIANPVTTRYWSSTPYRFGDTCMKFSAVPAELPPAAAADSPADMTYDTLADFLRAATPSPLAATPPKESSRDYLREALARTLALRGCVFLFQVQLWKDDETTPIDDPTVEWPEDVAPFHTVARLWIPKQAFDTSARMAFGENLSFTPWHAIPAHEPLGEINIVRRDVYSKLSALRHRLNGVEQREPEPGDPDPSDLPPEWGHDQSAFFHVLDDELDLIRKRRRHLEDSSRADQPEDDVRTGNQSAARDVDSLTGQARLRALDEHTTGLALAGQGARGAAFAVGFLQGLASLGLLRRIDYLSANSGGGAAAAWLATWLWRDGGGPANVERQLAPSHIDQARANRQYLAPGEVVDEEPETLRHLRFYASHNPHAWAFSRMDWIRVASSARNLMIHLLTLVPLLVLIVVAARAIVALYGILDQLAPLEDQAAQFDSRLRTPFFILGIVALALMFLGAAIALGLALLAVGRSLRDVRRVGPRSHQEHGPSDSVALVKRRICTRVLAATLLLSYCLPQIYHGLALLFDAIWYGPGADSLVSPRTFIDAALGYFTLLGWPNFLAHALLIGGGLAFWSARNSSSQDALVRRKFSVASFIAGATGGALIVLLEGLYRWFVQLGRLDLAATFIPPLSLLIVVAAVVVAVALAGRAAGDAERAWWAATSATLTKRAICWIAVMATLLYLPGAVFAVGGLARTAIAAVWLGIGAFGVFAGRYVLRRRDTARARWLAWPASIAAQLFFAGLLGAAGLLVSLLANVPSPAAPGATMSPRSPTTFRASRELRS